MPPNKRQPDFSKSRSLVVFLKRVIIYRLPFTGLIRMHSLHFSFYFLLFIAFYLFPYFLILLHFALYGSPKIQSGNKMQVSLEVKILI